MSMLNEFVDIVFIDSHVERCRIVDTDQGWVKLLPDEPLPGGNEEPFWISLESIQYMKVYEPERDRRPAPPAAP
jgi:hypothetical protein